MRSRARSLGRILDAGKHLLRVIDDILDEAGTCSAFAENGRQAVDLIAAAPTAFDVVLMDVQMPEMDGWDGWLGWMAGRPPAESARSPPICR